MYEMLRRLSETRSTPTREMTLILARCCRCGAEHTLTKQNVVRANREERTHCPTCIEDTFHRMTETRFYAIWKGMKNRATNPEDPDYPRYGAVGRGLAPDWLKFENFYRDMFPIYSDGMTIERMNNAKGYSKQNCRWATPLEQQANKNRKSRKSTTS